MTATTCQNLQFDKVVHKISKKILLDIFLQIVGRIIKDGGLLMILIEKMDNVGFVNNGGNNSPKWATKKMLNITRQFYIDIKVYTQSIHQ